MINQAIYSVIVLLKESVKGLISTIFGVFEFLYTSGEDEILLFLSIFRLRLRGSGCSNEIIIMKQNSTEKIFFWKMFFLNEKINLQLLTNFSAFIRVVLVLIISVFVFWYLVIFNTIKVI
jgi:hypothetical protein